MSKWQLPTRKGTTLFPQVTRTPVVVRFQGVPAGSPLAQQLLDTFRGQIDQFYLKASSSYALGIVEQAQLTRRVPGLSMRYLANQGHEMVQVTVAAEVVEQISKQVGVKPQDRFNWALIEFDVVTPFDQQYDDFTLLDLQITARFRSRPERYVTHTYGPENDQELVRFPYAEITTVTGEALPDNTWRASLLVDLRPFPDASVVEVDLWGVSVMNANVQLGWGSIYTGSDAPVDHGYLGTFTSNEDSPSYRFEPSNSPAPVTFWPWPSDATVYDIPHHEQLVRLENSPLPPPDASDPGFGNLRYDELTLHAASGLVEMQRVWSSYTISVTGAFPGPYTIDFGMNSQDIHWSVDPWIENLPVSMPLILSGLAFRETPAWQPTAHATTGFEFSSPTVYQWDVAGRATRLRLPEISRDIELTKLLDPVDNADGYYMGRVDCSVRTGAISYRPRS